MTVSYKRFIDVCTELTPDYAAILNEDEVPCLYDLRRGEGYRSFHDFFVSFDAYDARVISGIEALYADSYTERLRSGLFVSTSPVYNPKGRGIHWETAYERSRQVAKMLGTAWRHR